MADLSGARMLTIIFVVIAMLSVQFCQCKDAVEEKKVQEKSLAKGANDTLENELSALEEVSNTRQYGSTYGGCPLCDASVYSYCSHKLIHDSCCCGFPAHMKPPQCYYYDCALLYAKSCYEHSLIRNCCCNSPY